MNHGTLKPWQILLYLNANHLSIGKTLIFGFVKPDFWVRDWMSAIKEQGILDPAVSISFYSMSLPLQEKALFFALTVYINAV